MKKNVQPWLLLFLLIVTGPGAVAQTISAIVAMSKNTGYEAQSVAYGTVDLPQNLAENYLKNKIPITELYGCESHITTVFSKNAKLAAQKYFTQPEVSPAFFAEERKKGNFVTAMAYKNGVWTTVTSQNSGYESQTILVEKKRFPTEAAEEWLKKNFRITEVTFGNNQWVVVLSSGTGWGEQSIIYDRKFADEDVQRKIDAGFALTDANAGNGYWALVFTKNTGIEDQKFQVVERFPVDWVQEMWNRGYRINEAFNETFARNAAEIHNFPHSARLNEELSAQNVEWFKKFVTAYAPTEDAFVAVQRLASVYAKEKKWSEAAAVYESYRSLFPAMADRFQKIIALLRSPEDLNVAVEHLSANVNTAAQEYLPLPTADGQGLYFTAYNRGNRNEEDVFYSIMLNGQPQKAVNLGSPVNTKSNEAAIAVSSDGTKLFLNGNFAGSLGRGDIFYSEKTAKGWSAIQHFDSPINSPYFDSGLSISADGKAMFIVSDRPDGVGDYRPKDAAFHGCVWGNLDIYVCLKTANGWGAPVNLGKAINTPFAERSPYLHPDGKTLYFSSDGHAGLGRLDVFKSVRLNDSWTEWSEPVNLGKMINTIDDDYGFVISTAGDCAYFSSNSRKDSYGADDIYVVKLPASARPQPVAAISGQITDGVGAPLAAEIMIEDLEARQIIHALQSDPQTGKYFVALPMGKNYGYFIKKEGFYPVSGHLDLQHGTASVLLNHDVEINSIQDMIATKESVRINNLFFDTDKAVIKPESFPELDRLAAMLKTLSGHKIEISGHTDNEGAEDYNQSLSEQRAKAVAQYLIAQGLPADKILFKGYGKNSPVADNATEEGRAQNRRVEFKFIQ